jgi:multisubunit Na+/H+ antiporter MnhB subunit
MKVRRHPILGFFAGLFLGIGIALMLFVFGIVPMSAMWLGIVVGGFAVLGIAAAYAVPARGRGAVPASP